MSRVEAVVTNDEARTKSTASTVAAISRVEAVVTNDEARTATKSTAATVAAISRVLIAASMDYRTIASGAVEARCTVIAAGESKSTKARVPIREPIASTSTSRESRIGTGSRIVSGIMILCGTRPQNS